MYGLGWNRTRDLPRKVLMFCHWATAALCTYLIFWMMVQFPPPSHFSSKTMQNSKHSPLGGSPVVSPTTAPSSPYNHHLPKPGPSHTSTCTQAGPPSHGFRPLHTQHHNHDDGRNFVGGDKGGTRTLATSASKGTQVRNSTKCFAPSNLVCMFPSFASLPADY